MYHTNSQIEYKNGRLYLSGQYIEDIVSDTPVHVYSKQHIIEQYHKLNNYGKNPIYYAVKANFNPQIIKIIIDIGSGFDCVSQGEIERVMSLGANPKDIVFSGVGKTLGELEFAAINNIKQINCESLEELEELSEIAKQLEKIISVGLRVNIDFDVNTHKYIATAKKTDKFGIAHTSIIDACNKIKDNPWLCLVGLSIHIGSQILDCANFEDAFQSFAHIANSVRRSGHAIGHISVGGGLGIAYRPEEASICETAITRYLHAIEVLKLKTGLIVILEPGRFLVGNSCVTIAEVVRVKKTDSMQLLILNVGMNNIIRPALYHAYHHIAPVLIDSTAPQTCYKIVGPVCESADVFHESYTMQTVVRGDKVAIFSTGAYCRSMASDYNLMPIAQEIVI